MSSPDPASLTALQIRLEYDLDAQERLIVCPGSTEQAQCVVYRFGGGGRIFYSHKASNLPSLALRQSLDAVLFANSITWE